MKTRINSNFNKKLLVRDKIIFILVLKNLLV
nr:MAG TPA: hypothetical protein [Bacteriophage sp.]